MSRRYLGLPDWEGLLKHASSLTNKPHGFFVTSGDGDPAAIATAIAEELRGPWWDDEIFEESRSRFGSILSTRSGPLKAEISKLLIEAIARFPDEGLEAEEIRALRSAIVDGVITTNYDGLLEAVFPSYKVFVGQDELLFSDPQGIGEIYKIHGSVLDPESLVLTQKDYSDFHKRNPYLAAKLLTIFVEHPVVFLGYSLRDPDVTAILASIATVLTQDNLAKLEDNLVLVEWDPDVQHPTLASGLVTASGFTIPVKVLRVSSFLELFAMLGTLQHKFSAPVLRRLKQHIYELVLSNSPSERLYVADFDDLDDADVDVVIGVGMQSKLGERGYRGIQRFDLLLDVLQERSQYNVRQIVEDVIPDLLRQTGITPMYRYLREAGLLGGSGQLVAGADVHPKIAAKVALGGSVFVVPASTQARAARLVEAAGGQLASLDRDNGTSLALACAPALPREDLDLEELRLYLLEKKSAFVDNQGDRANWTRLVGWYDYLKFGLEDS